MRDVINNIINSYQIQAKALNVLLANTQKALEQSEKKRKADEQAQRVESFVKELTVNLNNILTKFYWLEERKKRRHEEVTSEEINAMVDYAHWVRSLTGKVQSVLKYFRKDPTFAEKVDRDIKELEAHIKTKLKKFNEILDETPDSLAVRLSKYAKTLRSKVSNFLTNQSLSILRPKQLMHPKKPKQPHSNEEEISAFLASSPDEELENLVHGLNISSAQKSNNKSKSYTYSKI